MKRQNEQYISKGCFSNAPGQQIIVSYSYKKWQHTNVLMRLHWTLILVHSFSCPFASFINISLPWYNRGSIYMLIKNSLATLFKLLRRPFSIWFIEALHKILSSCLAEDSTKIKSIWQIPIANLLWPPHTGCPIKNDPTLQCHIFKNIEFDVLKFSTVI